MIISGGSNIYPREIEDVLLRHPGVARGRRGRRAASGMGRGSGGLRGVARPAQRSEPRSSTALCLDNIARYKRPKRYVFVDDLPKNNYGKVLKTALRMQLQNGSEMEKS